MYRGTRIPQLAGRYVFGEFSRIFNFPGGPPNFGRLLMLVQKVTPDGQLRRIQEFKGFAEAIHALGFSEGPFPPTLAVLGMGQDAAGEIYPMGNISGVPFGDKGVVLRLAPFRGR